ncbi:hypothetical protein MAR_018552 [Mya arenaria]|uniref:Ig-like domain-containing protein n=1 Tax=Mya arenaria TaxID=6604 RepID=A0ABY7EHG1_MYAAR|nr:hypothetical protein MAR_018552 [Mya arenaria]
MDNQTSITAGKRVYNPTNEYTYFSKAEIGDIDTMRNLFFRLYNDEESVNVRLNISEILINSTQVLPKPQRNYLKVETKFKAPNETDLVIPAVLNQKAEQPDRFEFAEVFFTGLNTSSSPPAIFEIMHFNSDGINLAVSPLTETSSNLNITLRYPFARYGGILTVRMPYQEVIGGVIEEFYYGPFIKIVSSGEDSVVPPNTIGVFPIARQTLVIPPSQTVICAAMGNPRPEVSILKLGEGGTSVEIPSETVILDSTMNMIVHTFDASNPLTTEGRYFCRASNSFQTIDAPTEVIVLQPAVFDDRMTAVVQNSSDRIVISCQAKGKPKPQLKLKLYDEFGPDLVATGLYRIWKYGPEPDTSRVTLTLSPLEDAAITAVVCESSQGGAGGAFTNSRKIEVHPGKANFDMGLYNRLNEAVRL